MTVIKCAAAVFEFVLTKCCYFFSFQTD